MEAAGAGHEAAGAGPEPEFGPDAEEGESGEDEWVDWDREDWVEGTGVNLEGAEAGAGAGDGPEAEPAADESWWEVIYGDTVEGARRAMELGMAPQASATAVEVDGAMGDGQLAKQLGDLGGQEGWRLGLTWVGQADSWRPSTSCLCCVCGV